MKEIKLKKILVFSFFILFMLSILSSDFLPGRFLFISNMLPEELSYFHSEKRILFLIIFFSFKPTRNLFMRLLNLSSLKSPKTYFHILCILLVIYTTQNAELNLPLFHGPNLPNINILTLILIVINVSLITAFHEELFFRVILFTSFAKKNYLLAFIVPSILFGLIHASMPISAFVISICFSFLLWRYKSIIIPILAHSLWNFIAIFF